VIGKLSISTHDILRPGSFEVYSSKRRYDGTMMNIFSDQIETTHNDQQ
jgi:hypothetical protein